MLLLKYEYIQTYSFQSHEVAFFLELHYRCNTQIPKISTLYLKASGVAKYDMIFFLKRVSHQP